jgi:hypothetical protein
MRHLTIAADELSPFRTTLRHSRITLYYSSAASRPLLETARRGRWDGSGQSAASHGAPLEVLPRGSLGPTKDRQKRRGMAGPIDPVRQKPVI